ncbi:MAG: tetratricopeptide repeat protein [bacterium]|nr:tetratricopeptide repeat protein [bacterium]MDT8396247.1 tetratricopeptide repeat protein [bacterium]
MSEDDIQRYERMLADDPESRAFAPLAEAYRKAGRLDDAIRTARAGLEVHPGYSGGLLVLGRALYESRELDPAVDVLRKTVADSPENYLGQKFLGKALRDKGDIQGALRALEAANFLSPEDQEVALILEEMKKKAEPPRKMEFEAGSGRGDGEGHLVTYEQKPTTVDGVELDPLPTEETFSFSPEGQDVTTDPVAVRPVTVVKTPVAEGPMIADEAVIDVPEDDVDEIDVDLIEEEGGVFQVDDVDDIDQFDPQIAAFMEEGENLAEASLAEEVIPGTVPEAPSSVQPPPDADEIVSVTETETVNETVMETRPAPPAPDLLSIPEPAMIFREPEQEPALDLDLARQTSEPVPQSPPSLDASATGGAISTETLADLYAQQGLTDKALEIYRQILQERPGDEVIELKISALEEMMEEQPAVQPPPFIEKPVTVTQPVTETETVTVIHPPPAPPQAQLVSDAVPGVPEPAAAPVAATAPAPVTEPMAAREAAAPGNKMSETLGRWLENAERMKQK